MLIVLLEFQEEYSPNFLDVAIDGSHGTSVNRK